MSAFVPSLSFATRPALSRSSLCGASLSSSAAPVKASVTMSERSAAVPFLTKPKSLPEDIPGYVGFDPLNFTDRIDIKWLQESELKHGRIGMLAVVGILAQEFVHLPDAQFSNPVATEALKQVPLFGLWQIFIACGIVEVVSYNGKMAYSDMFEDGGVPGDLGFNPLGMSPSDEMRLKEVKNGRLAMCAVGGFIHSMFIYKTPIIAQLLDFKPYPIGL